jgi:hypothetical protein
MHQEISVSYPDSLIPDLDPDPDSALNTDPDPVSDPNLGILMIKN